MQVDKNISYVWLFLGCNLHR